MKVKFANRIYEVLFTKELAGLTMYAVEDEPNHIDWLINVEVVDAKKKELKKIEEEEYNGEDYGIDSLYHAQRILEKTLGKVDGYQSDDGILEHKCAITAIKELYAQKQEWSEQDETKLKSACALIRNTSLNGNEGLVDSTIDWLKSLKDRVLPQPKQEWSEEDEGRLKGIIATIKMVGCRVNNNATNCSYINWLKSLRERYTWKPSDEQIKVCKEVYADILSAKGFDLGTVNSELNRMEEELKKLRE